MRTLLAVAMLTCATQAYGQRLLLPQSPLDPNYDDCRRLNAAFFELLKPQHEAISKCMQNPPQFGVAPACSGREIGQVIMEYQAWAQCSGEEVTICEIKGAQNREVRICHERAKNRQEQERAEQEKRKVEERERNMAVEQLKRANDLYERFDAGYRFINSPASFFKRALEGDTKALDVVLSKNGNVNSETSEEVYRYLFNQARAGIRNTSNPIVRSIQFNSLMKLETHFNRTMNELHEVGEAIRHFNVTNPPASSPRPVLRSSNFSGDDPCLVLKDANASRALMERDQQLWLNLVQRCE